MERVFAYVDGFNLYFGHARPRWRHYLWLNVHQLANNLLRPGQVLGRSGSNRQPTLAMTAPRILRNRAMLGRS